MEQGQDRRPEGAVQGASTWSCYPARSSMLLAADQTITRPTVRLGKFS